MVNDRQAPDLERQMQGSSDTHKPSHLSDAELLRTIGADLRSLYSDFLKQPLPSLIEAALMRVDEKTRPAYERRLQAAF
jgi:hypothetical protein